MGNKTAGTTEYSRSHKPVLCERPKRKLISIFTPTTLHAKMRRQRRKRGRKPIKSDKPAVDVASVPNKGLFASLFICV